MKHRVLVIYSNPPGQTPLRLDKEDRVLMRVARRFSDEVIVERQHASDIEDIHSLLIDGQFDVIQFSGHGSNLGICLERANCTDGETVNAERLVSLLALSEMPLVVLLVCCYSESLLPVLSAAAPFVITTFGEVTDDACLAFVEGFYENYFRNPVVSASFDHAVNLVRARNLDASCFRLLRSRLVPNKQGSVIIKSKPLPNHDPILINIDAVKEALSRLNMPEEQFCYEFSNRLRIHLWIFNTPREQVLIPMGQRLFGEFGWENAKDIVYCKRLFRLRADVSQKIWKIWSGLLNSYNDLAACEYRHPDISPSKNTGLLEEAISLFQHHVIKYLLPAQSTFQELKVSHLEANIAQVTTHLESAADQLGLRRFQHVAPQLELALTNYHEVVNGLQPPEEELAN